MQLHMSNVDNGNSRKYYRKRLRVVLSAVNELMSLQNRYIYKCKYRVNVAEVPYVIKN